MIENPQIGDKVWRFIPSHGEPNPPREVKIIAFHYNGDRNHFSVEDESCNRYSCNVDLVYETEVEALLLYRDDIVKYIESLWDSIRLMRDVVVKTESRIRKLRGKHDD